MQSTVAKPPSHLFGVPQVRKFQVSTPERAHQHDQLPGLFGFFDGLEPLTRVFDLRQQLRPDLALNRLQVPANLTHRNQRLTCAQHLVALIEELNPTRRGLFLARHRYVSKVQK